MTLVEQLGDDTLVGGMCSLLSFGTGFLFCFSVMFKKNVTVTFYTFLQSDTGSNEMVEDASLL